MPTINQMSLNPNDRLMQGKGAYAKKQYSNVNQHYIHHNAVIPDIKAQMEANQRLQDI